MSKAPAPNSYDGANSLATGLTAFWLLSEGAGAPKDLSGHAHALALHGGCAWAADAGDPVLSLDGTSGYAEVLTPLVTAGDFSLHARVKPSTTNLGGVFRLIAAQGRQSDGTYVGFWMNDGGTLSYQVNGVTTHGPTGVALLAGTWYDLTLVYSAGTVTLYVNGASAAAATDTADYTGDRFELGVTPSGNLSRCFRGELDTAGVWSRALTPTEVSSLHAAPYALGITVTGTYDLLGPAAGAPGVASTAFTVTPGQNYIGTVTVTLNGCGYTGQTVTLSWSGTATPQTFTVTPTAEGVVTLTAAASPPLIDPGPTSYTAHVQPFYPCTVDGTNPIAAGLVAYWPGSDAAGTSLHDATGHGHTLALQGGAAWDGAALSLDGLTGYALGGGQLLTAGDFTLFARFKPATTSLGGRIRVLLSHGTGPGGTYVGVFLNDGGTVGFQAGNSTYNSTAALAAGAWHDVAFTFSGGTTTGYIDGAPAAAGPDTAVYTADRFMVGCSASSNPARCAPGDFNLAGVWSRALSAGAVASLHATPGQLLVAGALSYTLAGPAAGTAGRASAPFTVAPAGGGPYSGVVTPHTTVTGTFFPPFLEWRGTADAQTITYTPGVGSGSPHSVSVTASPALGTAPAAVSYAVVPPASSYSLSGPPSGPIGVASTAFTVAPVGGPWSGTVTPQSTGTGTFTPTSLTWNDETGAQTFTYNPSSVTGSPHQVSTTASPGLGTNPAAVGYAVLPSYTLTGPLSGLVGAASGNFTATPTGGNYTGPVTVTLNGGGYSGQTIVLTFGNSSAPQTCTVLPTAAGLVTLAPASGGARPDPPALTYDALAYATAYTLSGPPSGDCGAPFAFQIPVPPDFTHQTPANTFTVALPPHTTLPSPVTVTPSDDTGRGAFYSAGRAGQANFRITTVTLSAATRAAAFDYVCHDWGPRVLRVTAGGSLTDPAPAPFLAKIQLGSSGTYGWAAPHGGPGTGSTQCLDLGGYDFTTPGGPWNAVGNSWWTEFGRDVTTDPVSPTSNTLLWSMTNGALSGTVGFNFGSSGYYGNTGNAVADSRHNTAPENVVPGDFALAPLTVATYPGADFPARTTAPLFPTMSLEDWIADANDPLNGLPTVPTWNDNVDRHTVVYVRDETTGGVKEIYELQTPWLDPLGGGWYCVSGLHLTAGQPHRDGEASSDAAGLPLTSLLLRYDEVARGTIDHALRVDIPADYYKAVFPALAGAGYLVTDFHVYLTAPAAAGDTTLHFQPSTAQRSDVVQIKAGDVLEFGCGHSATVTADVFYTATTVPVAALAAPLPAGDAALPMIGIPMGARLRLKQSYYDATKDSLPPDARVAFDALRKHGAVVADGIGGGSSMQLCGPNDSRWQITVLTGLAAALPHSAFEFVAVPPRCVLTGPLVGRTGVALNLYVTDLIPGDSRMTVKVAAQWATSFNTTTQTPSWQTAGVGPFVEIRDGQLGPLPIAFTPPAAGNYLVSVGYSDQNFNHLWPVPRPLLITVTDAAPAAATRNTLSGPYSGTAGVASAPFTVTPDGTFSGTITPSDGGAGGAFTPASLVWSAASDPKTFTYLPRAPGTVTVSTSAPGLAAPAALTYTAAAAAAAAPPPGGVTTPHGTVRHFRAWRWF